MNDRLIRLQADLQGTQNAIDVILAKPEQEDRLSTEEEIEQVEALRKQFSNITREIENLEQKLNQDRILAASAGRKTEPTPLKGDDKPALKPPAKAGALPAVAADTGKCGFANVGEFALSVRAHFVGAGFDPKLKALTANESVGSDGGFLVPPDFRKEIMDRVFADDSLASMCDQNPVSGNALKQVVDESLPWDTSPGTGGVKAYWVDERDPISDSRPVLRDFEAKLNKLGALVNVTEEVLEDASSMNNHIRKKAPEAMRYLLNEAILFGTGAGTPNGVVNSNCRVMVPKEAGQAADTVRFENVSKMRNRMHPICRRNAVWLINPDLETELEKMFLPTGSTGVAVFMPATGVSQSGYSTLYNRPVVPLENCKALGDEGDIVFADLTQYALITKQGGGVRQDSTISLYFANDIRSFRFILRVGGQPWWSKPWNRPNGLARSCFVTLAERA
jgi:HK97 family phage major capsid protein